MKNETRTRILFITATLLLLLTSAISLIRYARSTTDENWFRDPPSRISITKDLPAAIPHFSQQYGMIDSVKNGDLLLGLNDKKITRQEQIARLRAQSRDTVYFHIFRPQLDQSYRLPVLATHVPDSFTTRLPNYVYVFSVLPGGASDRAGMQKGDLITKIKGKSFQSTFQADLILRQNKPGETIAYTVLRQNEEITLYLTLSVFGIFVANIIALIVGLFFIACGLFYVLNRPSFKAARLIAGTFILVGFIITVAYTQREPQFDAFSVLRVILLTTAGYLSLAFFIHSQFYFPRPLDMLPKKKFLIVLYVLASVFLTAQIYFQLAASSASAAVGAGMLLMILMFGMFMLFHHKKIPQEIKVLRRPIKYSLIAALAGAFLFLFILSNIGQVFVVNAGYLTLFFLLIPLAYLYTTGRYALMGLNIRLRRNFQYTLVSSLWRLAMLVLTIWVLFAFAGSEFELPNLSISPTSIELLERELPQQQRLFLDRIIFIVFAAIVIFLAWKITQLVQRFINRRFHQSKFDYRYSMEEISTALSGTTDPQSLCTVFVKTLHEVMRLKKTGIGVFDKNHEIVLTFQLPQNEANGWKALIEKNHAGLYYNLLSATRPQRPSDLSGNLAGPFESAAINLFVPAKTARGALQAILLIGEKQSESPFHQDDFDFLSAAAARLAVALENSFLYLDLAQQERIKHELAIARDIQMSSLPQKLPAVSGLDVAGLSIPALEVGGDYFDYLNGSSNALTVVVGDVSGKGTSSALYMSKIQGILRSLNSFSLQPSELFIRANTILTSDMKKQYFITALAGSFDVNNHLLKLARAGHLPLYHYCDEKQSINSIAPEGLGMGIGSGEAFAENMRQSEIVYKKGDIFVFLTDGITETTDPEGQMLDESGILEECILQTHHQPAKEICRNIIDAAVRFAQGQNQADDMTVVVVKIIG